MSIAAIIEAKKVSKSFGQFKALDRVSLQIQAGEILALLGANGAGKTTLINLLLGRMRSDSGSLSVLNYPAGHIKARKRIGTILQSAQMPGTLKVAEHIELFSSYYDQPLSLQETLEKSQLTQLKDKRFDQLSGGQKQRVFFALAICGNPEVVFLDEPTVGLDVDTRRQLWRCIRDLKDQGTAVLLTTHYLEEADMLADRIVLLSDGRITAEGSPEQIKKRLGGKIIRFKSNLTAAHLSQLTAVDDYQAKGNYHELLSQQTEATLRSLLNVCTDIQDLTISQVTLEDAFINLSEHQTHEKIEQEKSA
ncbi:ABC transporter ATP-binding protein [Marinicella gelatinilytica]|uniref:ABC transporter ATP-binding protein n=1 Tax=Marinicella gelatinilytica TaxID=2996017 RepID=UPI002260A8E4|nr:ABC transporter ATP-binding protein [Marinicella gelatinilytica]MCX7544659.1 ABC transporter ATP-binding protein [Marinicella gelatinilytica]